MSTAKQFLVEAFEIISNEVPFNPQWANGTGYLDNAVTDNNIQFDVNGYAKSSDEQGRKIVLVKTRLGNVAVFQRYAGDDEKVVVTNMPCAVSKMLLVHGSLSGDQVESLIGTPKYPSAIKHIGKRLEDISKFIK